MILLGNRHISKYLCYTLFAHESMCTIPFKSLKQSVSFYLTFLLLITTYKAGVLHMNVINNIYNQTVTTDQCAEALQTPKQIDECIVKIVFIMQYVDIPFDSTILSVILLCSIY